MKKRILVINRGEIAVRIIKTIKDMGYESVVVHSIEDSKSQAVLKADYSICIGGASSLDSYLNIPNILVVATSFGVDAIHPGYGFLSEKTEFVSLCEELNLNFIGPSSVVMAKMGDKISALETVANHIVGQKISFKEIIDLKKDVEYIISEFKFPLMIKHSGGGGGKGMRIVYKKEDLLACFEAVKNEAMQTDLTPRIFVEPYINNAKHVEIQVVGDKFGNVIHLGSRDCTMQRNNQKLVEEAPSTCKKSLLSKMYKTSVDVCKSIGYIGVGTFEYMVVGDEFYFLEMNTRLQVEHTVTEEVTGIDLVKLQIDIALGKELSIKQEDVKISGHAIEVRINAEDPKFNFAPTPGLITKLDIPGNKYLRTDFGFIAGDRVSPYYDSMIGKLIVKRRSREMCINTMSDVLKSFAIDGVKSTALFNYNLINSDEFKKKSHTTNYIKDNINKLLGGL